MRIAFCILVFLMIPACGGTSARRGHRDRGRAPGGGGPLPPDLGTRPAGIDWPCFQGPHGDSVSLEKGIVTPWPKAGPRLVWESKVGESYCMPSISRGRAFVFDRMGKSARIRALKSETGEKLWEFAYPTDYVDQYRYSGGPRCCPVVDGDRVYTFGPEGMLHCLKAETGKLVWKVNTAADFHVVQNFFGVGSTPVVEGDLLIAMVGGSPKDSDNRDFMALKSDGSAVVAFDKLTGKVKYKLGDDLASYSSPMLTTIDGRRWCFVFARAGLLGFDPATGKSDFHYPWRARTLESVNAANPLIAGNKVLISETYGPGSALLEVKPGGHKEIWTDLDSPRQKALQAHWCTPIHMDGYVYGCSGPPREQRRAALHRAGDGKSNLARAGPDADDAAADRWALHRPGRERRLAVGEGESEEIRGNLVRRAGQARRHRDAAA